MFYRDSVYTESLFYMKNSRWAMKRLGGLLRMKWVEGEGKHERMA